jgi:hypothetical protein
MTSLLHKGTAAMCYPAIEPMRTAIGMDENTILNEVLFIINYQFV